jgi:twitching motility protein PilT
MEEILQKFEKVLKELIEAGGSDLHIREGRVVSLRIKRVVNLAIDIEVFSRGECLQLIKNFLSEDKINEFSDIKSADFSAVALGRRLRGNVFIERNKIGMVFRLVPVIQTIEDLNLPKVLEDLALREQGFFLVTGSVGNGKSTTMAAMVSLVNLQKQKHIHRRSY